MTVIDLPYPFDGERDLPPFSVPRVNNYKRAGWKSVIPLPYGKQDPPPTGFSGRNPTVPKKDQYIAWLDRVARQKQGTGNIAIVHNELTLAVDVDDYDYVDKKTGETKRKRGGESLAALEEVLGPLPDTWRSTARGWDNPSGQRFFRIKPEQSPKLLDWDDKPGPHIEIVRWGHRYSVVWPSMNGRLGEVYRWLTPRGLSGHGGVDGEGRVWADKQEWIDLGGIRHDAPFVPSVEDLPYLPDAWVDYLTRGFSAYKDTPRVDLDDDAAGSWIDGRPDVNGEPCQIMRKVIDRALEDLPNGAHDASRDRLMEMFHLAAEGHIGLRTAVHELQVAFFDEVQGRRSHSAAQNEWFREYRGAVERAAARPDPATAPCACWDAAADGDGAEGSERDPATYALNDTGNAEHLIEMVNGQMIWGSGYEKWLVWDMEDGANVWRLDDTSMAVGKARLIGPRLDRAAGKLFASAKGMEDGDEKDKATRKADRMRDFAVQTGNIARINGMLSVARSFAKVSVPMDKFDANPYLLTCLGSTLELLPRGTKLAEHFGPDGLHLGVRERGSELEDYSLNYTGLEYFPWDTLVPGGLGAAYVHGRAVWEDYLDTFIPNLELRWFIQRLFGYSLMGANPERKIVFLQGLTSTGKSTILEAVSAALGRYAKSFNLSMFRESMTEAPRPDIVEALTRRIITATEGDAEWHLHADTIKRMVGGVDQIKARNLHSNVFLERAPAFVPFVATNSSPTIAGADSALWQRVIVVPFNVQMLDGNQKKNASVVLQTDVGARTAVLSWLVEGYIGYVREGIDDLPAVVVDAIQEFRGGVSEWHTFMNQQLLPIEGARVETSDVYRQYESWCEMNGIERRSRVKGHSMPEKCRANGYDIQKFKRPGTQNKVYYIMGFVLRQMDTGEYGGLIAGSGLVQVPREGGKGGMTLKEYHAGGHGYGVGDGADDRLDDRIDGDGDGDVDGDGTRIIRLR